MNKIYASNISATPEVARLIAEGLNLKPLLDKHFSGNWGDINETERAMNIASLENNTGHVLSVYRVTPEITLWISTKAGKTILMLPLA